MGRTDNKRNKWARMGFKHIATKGNITARKGRRSNSKLDRRGMK